MKKEYMLQEKGKGSVTLWVHPTRWCLEQWIPNMWEIVRVERKSENLHVIQSMFASQVVWSLSLQTETLLLYSSSSTASILCFYLQCLERKRWMFIIMGCTWVKICHFTLEVCHFNIYSFSIVRTLHLFFEKLVVLHVRCMVDEN